MTCYSDNPAEKAKHWLEIGAKWLHVINLDGAFGEHDFMNHLALESILKVAKSSGAQVQFGGGLRSLDTIERAMDAGVDRIVLGTIAVTQPAMVGDALTRFGADQIAVGIDARDGWVRVHGWKDNSGIAAADLALQMKTIGLHTVIFTDVSRDGLGGGLNIDATRALAEVSGLNVIASGGVHTLEDVMAAQRVNLSGVIIGRAIYEGSLDLKTALQEVTDAR